MANLRWEVVHLRYRSAIAADTQDFGLQPGAVRPELLRTIDVRHAVDFAAGRDMVEGATWHDPAGLADWCRQLDPGQPLLVYCVKGLDIGRSVALALRVRGFDARYLIGGIDAWRSAGSPLRARRADG